MKRTTERYEQKAQKNERRKMARQGAERVERTGATDPVNALRRTTVPGEAAKGLPRYMRAAAGESCRDVVMPYQQPLT